MNSTGWLILMLPLWAIIIGVIDWILFSWALKCPVCKDNIKVRWWWFIVPTMLELMMFVIGYTIGVN